MKITSNQILIANSLFQETCFYESVVLILEHNDTGTLGIILNKISDISFSNSTNNDTSDHQQIPLMLGGPVSTQTILILHNSKKLSLTKKKVLYDIYLDQDVRLIPKMQKEKVSFYIYQGYSAWEKYQLEEEIDALYWNMKPIHKNFLFHVPPSNMWRQSLVELGGLYTYYAKYVKNPLLN